ncbi:hypothetical protein ACWD0Z_18540 [Streptomyces sp. NPDC003007]
MSADLGICLRGGRYSLTDTFTLGNADSGINGHRVVYTAYLGETPVIDGGKAVRGWTKVEGKPYWSANVSTSAGYAPYFRQLYVDGVRARLATSKAIAGTAFFDDPGTPFAKEGVVFPAASWKNYSNLTDVRLVHAGCGFKGDYFPVAGVTADGTSAKVKLQQPYFQARVDRGGTCFNYNQKFYVQNAVEELDSAGEFYLDQAADRIYYYPLAGQNMSTASTTVPVVEKLLTVTGATGISLMNTYSSNVTQNLVHGTAYMGIHQRMGDEFNVYEGVDGIGNMTISYNKVLNAGDKKMWGVYDNGAVYSFGAVPGTNIHHNYVTKVTTHLAYMNDNQSYQIRWDDNVADGGVFSAATAVRAPKSVYAARNYATASGNYANFTFDVDGPPHVVSNNAWPAAAQSIIDGAGLQGRTRTWKPPCRARTSPTTPRSPARPDSPRTRTSSGTASRRPTRSPRPGARDGFSTTSRTTTRT